jgi:hypothetical protein
MPAARRTGKATNNNNNKSSKRHSLDHLLPSYKPNVKSANSSPLKIQSKSPIQKNKNKNKKNATPSGDKKKKRFNEMPAKSNNPPARTSRRGQPLDPAVAAFFDPKTSVTAELLSPGGGATTFSRKNGGQRGAKSNATRKSNDSKKKPLQVKKTVATKKPAPPPAKKKAPAKKTAVPKAPQNSTQYIMAERRRKSRPERPIKSLTSPRAERLASPGVPPKSNLNMFGSMMPQAMKEDDEVDDGEDLHELIGDIFDEKPIVAASKKRGGNAGGRGGNKSNAESSLYDAQNTLIESQAKRIGELQNEIIRLKMKLRDYEDEKMMTDSNASQRLMERMKGLFKF